MCLRGLVSPWFKKPVGETLYGNFGRLHPISVLRPLTILLLLLALTLGVIGFLSFTDSGKRFQALHLPKTPKAKAVLPDAEKIRLRSKASEAVAYTRSKGFNTRYAFLIDMRLPSGSNRFFLYDLQADSVLHRGLVTHGRCNEEWLEGRRYGNEVGCGCTSLGKYKVGYRYMGKFGLAYKLHGLDKTNSNAFERYVVLHSHDCVPGREVSSDICQSDGCPTISPACLKQIAPVIDRSKAPLLLWIFE